jgi:hypothetical protein
MLPARLRILGHRIILLCGRFADPFGNTVGDELARMLKRDDVRAVARRFFIADPSALCRGLVVGQFEIWPS